MVEPNSHIPDRTAARLRQALLSLCERAPAHTTGHEAKRRIRLLESQSGCSLSDLGAFWADASTFLGPFDDLPAGTRSALANAASYYFREKDVLTSDRLFQTVHGPVFRFATRLAGLSWAWRMKRGGRGVLGRASKAICLTCRALTAGHVQLGRRWLALTRNTRFSKTPFIYALWKYAGIDPTDLIHDYIHKIPFDPRLAPVFIRSQPMVASCALVGLDLLMSKGRIYYLEANFNSGLRPSPRLVVYPDGDPIGLTIARYAAENGYSRIVFYPYALKAHFKNEMEVDWRRSAERAGVSFEVRDYPFVGSPSGRSTDRLMDLEAEGTLYVNSRRLNGPLEILVAHKGRLEREIDLYNSHHPNGQGIAVPRIFSDSQALLDFDPDSRFPNLIVKTGTLDQGKGIAVLKADRVPAGATTWPQIAFEYVPPDCVQKRNGSSIKEHATKYRSYLLLTPDGPLYIGVVKAVAAIPVPDRLPTGPVADPRPFVVNSYSGCGFAPTSQEEEDKIRETSLRVGAVIDDHLRRKHDIVIDDVVEYGKRRETHS